MSGGIYNFDPVILPADCRVLGENRNTTLFLLIVGVHDALSTLVFAIEGSGLLQEAIDQSRFTVVDVSNDGDVT